MGRANVLSLQPRLFQSPFRGVHLDEPVYRSSPEDNDRLIASLKKMRDLNTLIVVEHDEDTMREADYLIGRWSWCRVFVRIVAVERLSRQLATVSHRDSIYCENARLLYHQNAVGNGRFIEVTGARENNLRKISPLASY